MLGGRTSSRKESEDALLHHGLKLDFRQGYARLRLGDNSSGWGLNTALSELWVLSLFALPFNTFTMPKDLRTMPFIICDTRIHYWKTVGDYSELLSEFSV